MYYNSLQGIGVKVTQRGKLNYKKKLLEFWSLPKSKDNWVNGLVMLFNLCKLRLNFLYLLVVNLSHIFVSIIIWFVSYNYSFL